MKKNPRDYKVNGKMYAYILDSISSDDVDVESMSDKERIEFALDMFYDEIYKNDRRRMSTLEKLTYWISGLCSYCECYLCRLRHCTAWQGVGLLQNRRKNLAVCTYMV